MTPSTRLTRPQKISSSILHIHQGLELSSLQDFLVTCSTNNFQELLFSDCLENIPSSPESRGSPFWKWRKQAAQQCSVHSAFSSPDQMTLVPLNMLQRTDDPGSNPHLSSPSVSLSQPRTGHGTGGSAVLATVGEFPHGSRITSSRF